MKILRGVLLGFWVAVMAGCVSLVAIYYILSQTILSSTAVKEWLNDSGTYGRLTEAIASNISASQSPQEAGFITSDMIRNAVKASIGPETAKSKIEPIIDATYAWLDSKSPEITFSISTEKETGLLLAALRTEVLTKLKSLATCDQYVAPEALATANCLPSYTTPEEAADVVMQMAEGHEALRDKTLTPDKVITIDSSTKRLPDLVSYLWVAQLIAMPIFGIVTLFLVVTRRGGGLVAVASALLSPGLTLLVLALILQVWGASLAETLSIGEKTGDLTLVEPFMKEALKDIATTTLYVGLILSAISVALGGLGIWWRKRARRKATTSV